MSTVSDQELQRDLPGLLSRVEAGEAIVVTRDNRPVAELRPLQTSSNSTRPHGLAAGEFTVPDDFDSPLPDDVIRSFEGR